MADDQRGSRGELPAPKSKIAEKLIPALKKLWEKKGIVFWVLVSMVIVVFWGPIWGTVGGTLGAGCDTAWDKPIVDGSEKYWCEKVNVNGAPALLTHISKGDSFKVFCSGSASMLLQYPTGLERKTVGCEGYTSVTPWQMKQISERNGFQFDLSQWPQINAPILGGMCQFVPTRNSFSKADWYNQKWSYLKYNSTFGKRIDVMGSMPYDAWVYCWANAPKSNTLGAPKGTFKFELIDTD